MTMIIKEIYMSNTMYYLKGRKFCDHKLLRTYFSDFGPKSQKFDPENKVWMSQSQKNVLLNTV